jgi:hypothetical protein
MFRRSLVALSSKTGRTVVRDPRKRSSKLPATVQPPHLDDQLTPQPYHPSNTTPLPFVASNNQQDQPSFGSSMVSYALAGVGMTLGFILVGSILGV